MRKPDITSLFRRPVASRINEREGIDGEFRDRDTGGSGIALLATTAFTENPVTLGALFGFSPFADASFSTMILVLPSDLYPDSSVATVSGLSGTGAGIGPIISTFII